MGQLSRVWSRAAPNWTVQRQPIVNPAALLAGQPRLYRRARGYYIVKAVGDLVSGF